MHFPDLPAKSVLGLSFSGDHDSAIAIVSPEGEVVFATSLERHSRIKHDGRFPFDLLAKVDWKNISRVAVSTRQSSSNVAQSPSLSFPKLLLNQRKDSIFHVDRFYAFLETLPLPITFVDHQDAHAASAAWGSNFDNCKVLTYDGGMYNSPSFGSIQEFNREDGLTNLDSFPNIHHPKITTFYSFITGLLGFSPNSHEGKITGLAANGHQIEELDQTLNNWFENKYDEMESVFRWYFNMSDDITAKLHLDSFKLREFVVQLEKFRKEDIAFAIQKFTEEHIFELLESARKHGLISFSENLCLAGGLFANVSLNRKIAELGFANVYVCPAMGDEGTSLGAAWFVASRNQSLSGQLRNVYLGPIHESDEHLIYLNQLGVSFRTSETPAEDIAKVLSSGKEVALFQGRAEFGPRALGNRTILAPAYQKDINITLNQKLNRTEFMPFAPVLRDISASKSFLGPSAAWYSSDFMTTTMECSEEFARLHPAVVHIDNTARPQIITADTNKLLYEILEKYENLSQEYALINTSFNVHEEPIVENLDDALTGFFSAGLSILFIEPNIIVDLASNQNLVSKFKTETRASKMKKLQTKRLIELLEMERNIFLENSLAWKDERDILLVDRDYWSGRYNLEIKSINEQS